MHARARSRNVEAEARRRNVPSVVWHFNFFLTQITSLSPSPCPHFSIVLFFLERVCWVAYEWFRTERAAKCLRLLMSNRWLLLMCPSSSTRRYWPPGAALALAHISAVGFHTQKCVRPRTHTHTHTAGPCRHALQLPVHFPQTLGVGLSGEHELSRCQETL